MDTWTHTTLEKEIAELRRRNRESEISSMEQWFADDVKAKNYLDENMNTFFPLETLIFEEWSSDSQVFFGNI